jgi:putative transcriptional regulator
MAPQADPKRAASTELRTGILIASPQMRDQWFEGAVILLCQHDDDGALGLVINKDGPVSVGEVLERMDLDPGAADRPTWWGGPVGTESGFVLWRGRAGVDEGWTLADEVAVSPSSERLSTLVGSGQRFFLVLGYAGWGPGQLEEELERGSWLLTEVDPEIVFDRPMAERYELALASLGLSAHSVVMNPISE